MWMCGNPRGAKSDDKIHINCKIIHVFFYPGNLLQHLSAVLVKKKTGEFNSKIISLDCSVISPIINKNATAVFSLKVNWSVLSASKANKYMKLCFFNL